MFAVIFLLQLECVHQMRVQKSPKPLKAAFGFPTCSGNHQAASESGSVRMLRPNGDKTKPLFLKISDQPLIQFLAACLTYLTFATALAEALPLALLGNAPPLQGQAIHYFADHPATAGYLATPIDQPSKGAVILIHEWNGLTQRMKETADALRMSVMWPSPWICIAAESVLIEPKTWPWSEKRCVRRIRLSAISMLP